MVKKVNEEEVVRLYLEERMTLRHVGEEMGIDHHRVKRILEKNNVKITRRNTLKEFSKEHREKLSKAMKGRPSYWKDKKMPEETNRKNMINHLKRSITLDDLVKYTDFNRLKFLNNVIARHRKHFEDDKKYISYLDKFYFDKAFNKSFDLWIENQQNKWFMPSLDHIIPLSKGGTFDLENLQFLTWFENRAKAEMTMEEWEKFKEETRTISDLFIENIMK